MEIARTAEDDSPSVDAQRETAKIVVFTPRDGEWLRAPKNKAEIVKGTRSIRWGWNAISSSLNSVSLIFHKVGSLVFFSLIVFLVGMDVVLRYFFNRPTEWVGEVCAMILLAALCLSLVRCWDEGKHIRMGLFYERFPSQWQACSNILTGLLGMGLFGLLGFECAIDIPLLIRTHEVGEQSAVPIWPFRTVMLLVAVLFCFQFIVFIVSSLKKLMKGDDKK